MADRRRNLGIPSGVVFPFAGNSAPYGYLICDGRAVSRTEYASLFLMIGTAHGIGDGSTTFNLPDYRGNFLRGKVDIDTVTGSGTAAGNAATFTNHGVNRTGFKVRLSSGTLTGLATSTDYYAIVVDNDTLAFATSLANALAGTRIVISGANTAVLMQYEDPDAGSRNAATVGGNSGNAVGGMQIDELRSHRHSYTDNNSSGGGSGPARNQGAGTYYTDYTGGQETRPKNLLINYIVKI